MMDCNELYHHGVKGQRWGVRRFQNKDGSLTALGKKKAQRDSSGKSENALSRFVRTKYAESVKKKAERAKQKKIEEELSREKSIEDQKADILKTRSPKTIYENAHLFSTSELQSVYNRLQLEKNISSLAPSEVSEGQRFVDKTINFSNKAATFIESGSKLYNNVAKVYNSFVGNKKGTALPTISDKVASKIDKMKEETERLNAETANREAKSKHSGRAADINDTNEETRWFNSKVANAQAKQKAADFVKDFMNNQGGSKTDSDKSTIWTDFTETTSSNTARNSNQMALGQRYVSGLLKESNVDDYL